MTTSRERVQTALDHRTPDRVPLDLGGTLASGMQVSTVYRLRQALGLDAPGTPVKVVEPYQMLGEIAARPGRRAGRGRAAASAARRTHVRLRERRLEAVDALRRHARAGAGGFNTDPEPNGDILMYPEGDKSAPPSGRMPERRLLLRHHRAPAADRRGQAERRGQPRGVRPDLATRTCEHFARRGGPAASADTDKAILANFGGTGFGDIALVPAPWLKHPRGIRDIEEWYVSTVSRRDYVYRIFERQCEIALANLERIYAVVGDRVTAVFVTGTDFGSAARAVHLAQGLPRLCSSPSTAR